MLDVYEELDNLSKYEDPEEFARQIAMIKINLLECALERKVSELALKDKVIESQEARITELIKINARLRKRCSRANNKASDGSAGDFRNIKIVSK